MYVGVSLEVSVEFEAQCSINVRCLSERTTVHHDCPRSDQRLWNITNLIFKVFNITSHFVVLSPKSDHQLISDSQEF